MEKEKAISELINKVFAAYPAIEVAADTMDVWLERLSCLDIADITYAINYLIDHNTRFPTVAEIRAIATAQQTEREIKESITKHSQTRLELEAEKQRKIESGETADEIAAFKRSFKH